MGLILPLTDSSQKHRLPDLHGQSSGAFSLLLLEFLRLVSLGEQRGFCAPGGKSWPGRKDACSDSAAPRLCDLVQVV